MDIEPESDDWEDAKENSDAPFASETNGKEPVYDEEIALSTHNLHDGPAKPEVWARRHCELTPHRTSKR